MSSVVEMYYTPTEASLLLRVHVRTILKQMYAGQFGDRVVNLGSELGPDWRIPASGLNAYLDARRHFSEPGLPARTEGELRRKVNGV